MSYIIVTRNPSNKHLLVINNGSDDEGVDFVLEFQSEGDARLTANNVPCCEAWGYEIVEVTKP